MNHRTPLPGSDPLVDALAAAGVPVHTRATDLLASAHDASHYLLTPRALAAPRTTSEVAATLAAAAASAVPVTFRSGGTSLSGQAVTDGLLVDTRRHFRDVTVLDAGARVRCGPGATVRAVNARLVRHRRELGPDPASEIACTIGGVVANNSSGMACGTVHNTYSTLASSVLVLPSGTVVDTAGPDADARLARDEPALHAGLAALRDRVRADAASVARIRALHAIKNTMGYGLNALLDHDSPVAILEHLVVGSEGTLAFVAEATFATVPLLPHRATGLLLFDDLAAATASLPALVAAGFATIELLDAASLRVAQADPSATPALASLDVVAHAALLVEFRADSADELVALVDAGEAVLAGLPLSAPASLSTDVEGRRRLWHVRKGLFTAVASARPSGTSALLEDIAVPVERLADTCAALVELFARHGYGECVIFGHAKDGNIHFLVSERFDDPVGLARYEAFTLDLVELVLARGGTLKAEHGTGRIMAPFVRRQVGDELYAVMRAVKELVDPRGLLNPGVLLTDDPDAHLRHLKTAPTVESEVDRCVECGYCEPVCPSRDLTLTPRQRIVLRREIARAEEAGDIVLADRLRDEYVYDGLDTCAVDSLCETACPVLIDTGSLVRRLRGDRAPAPERALWTTAARHWGATTLGAARALDVAAAVPVLPRVATDLARRVLGPDRVPRHTSDLPSGGRPRPRLADPQPDAVYFASCTATMFGPADGSVGVADAFTRLCARAGIGLVTPPDLGSLCCGTPWKSKGMTDGYAVMRDRVMASLRDATRGGTLPIVCDASSCTEGLRVLLDAAGSAGLVVVDAVSFVAERVLPGLGPLRRVESLTLHPTCSSTRLGLDAALLSVAEAVAESVVVPDDWGCCAFAGDRGMLHPELTASATAREAASVRAAGSAVHASVNRTCEIGLTRATGEPYRHVLEVLADAAGA